MGRNILVIDDNGAVRATLEHLLTREGYEVSTAADGDQGLNAALTIVPDLIVTDLIMPKREGIEIIQAIRQHRLPSKIIAMSGGARLGKSDPLLAARQVGADAIIVKPFELDSLITTVRTCLPVES